MNILRHTAPRLLRDTLAVLAAAVLGLVLSTGKAWSAELLKPYVLAYTTAAALEAEVAAVKGKLAAAGFEVIGEYAPYPGAHVVAVTHAELKAAAARPALSAFGATIHVGFTTVDGKLQVSYLNPRYQAAAYRLSTDLGGVAQTLAKTLGSQQSFGADEGRTAEQLRDFRYMVGMETFEDTYDLGSHASYEAAVKAVEANLQKQVGGAAKVYRLDLPGQRTLFGVSRAQVTDPRANDKHILQDTVDQKFSIKTTAYLPYTLLVDGKQVKALHMRFRMAVWHPDLTMVTFGKLMSSPGAIEELLAKVSGGKKESFSF
ncbi:hypothetical protein D0B54_22615 [Solimonas sp. K1W22B-7]|uniref:hypothetical protein n=1 Tax=Solimonas sp. K1W22B-7 TaxID=2303331 RepID=UPI000E3345EE|nr:hypothetical protein [Solimonas sp. K1W22B-7]AXQ31303.1 hypothetical protein D0B54_22615 [Solimonas sp. K1W22B-7]